MNFLETKIKDKILNCSACFWLIYFTLALLVFFEKSYVLYIHAKFFSGSTIDLKIISKLGKKYLVYLVRFW